YVPEDRNPDGILDAKLEPCEDLNNNGVIDKNEFDRGNCRLDPSEDLNGNGILDTEDLNHNGILDPGEDLNGNGVLDSEDTNRNGFLDPAEDRPDGKWTAFCPGEDTNGDGVFGTVFPGGNQFVMFNAEYTIPVADAVEFAFFYDAGNAFDDGQRVTLSGLRADFGLELRFYLPMFQAPLRLIYGFVQN